MKGGKLITMANMHRPSSPLVTFTQVSNGPARPKKEKQNINKSNKVNKQFHLVNFTRHQSLSHIQVKISSREKIQNEVQPQNVFQPEVI